MFDRTAVIIPTYNEKSNIERLIRYLKGRYPPVRIFVVDDNSPDGTAQLVQKLAGEFEGVKLIWRESKQGLASAYLDAFARVIPDESIEYIATMDADFSHHPEDLARLMEHAKIDDLVVGSRYVEGGKVENWRFLRRMLSKYANVYARLVTGVPNKDLTGGFVVYGREALGRILMAGITSEGYAYQIEMKYLAHKNGCKIIEVPITFRDRKEGKSKFHRGVFWEALMKVWYLRFRR